jgi:hypothetical protein
MLDVFGAVIPNLYAAGEVVAGFHGATYLSGTGLGKAGSSAGPPGWRVPAFETSPSHRGPAIDIVAKYDGRGR